MARYASVAAGYTAAEMGRTSSKPLVSPLIRSWSIEDGPLPRTNWEGWALLSQRLLASRVQLVGDDLFREPTPPACSGAIEEGSPIRS